MGRHGQDASRGAGCVAVLCRHVDRQTARLLSLAPKSVKDTTARAMAGDAPYDPDQDPEERRVVRKGYRTLAKNVEGSSPHPLNILDHLHRD